jgi:DNA-directed RNA polymerase subunit RPC12/RpoP
MTDRYRCARCGGEFVAVDEAAAQAEAKARWPAEIAANMPMAVICDDCDRAFRVWFRARTGRDLPTRD